MARAQAGVLAVLTIAAGLFVLGLFLALNGNLQRVVGRWTESAELSVYLKDDASAEQLRTIDALVERQRRRRAPRVCVEGAGGRAFPPGLPDLAGPAQRLEHNPFPASIEVRLKPEARNAGATVDNLAATLAGVGGVADVRYDRRWLARLNAVVRFLRAIGLVIMVSRDRLRPDRGQCRAAGRGSKAGRN